MFGKSVYAGNKRKHFETHDESKKVSKFLHGEIESLDCPVCLSETNEKVALWAKCRHAVCETCFKQIKVVSQCPVCRTQTPVGIFEQSGGMRRCVDICVQKIEETLSQQFDAAMTFSSNTGEVPVLVVYADCEIGKVLRRTIKGCISFDPNAVYSSLNPEWMKKPIERRGMMVSLEQIEGRNMQGFGGVVCVGWLKRDEMRTVKQCLQRYGCVSDRINIASVLPKGVE